MGMKSLWTPEEAWDFLNTKYRMNEMKPDTQAFLVNDLMKMAHRPWCRANMAASMPVYGADCTCDRKYDENLG